MEHGGRWAVEEMSEAQQGVWGRQVVTPLCRVIKVTVRCWLVATFVPLCSEAFALSMSSSSAVHAVLRFAVIITYQANILRFLLCSNMCMHINTYEASRS